MARIATARSKIDLGPSIIGVMENKLLLAPFFQPVEAWRPWKICLSAMFGLPPPNYSVIDAIDGSDEPERLISALEFYQKHTGRSQWPTKQASEAWIPTGVRGGKALALDTPVPTPGGWTTMGDIAVGDVVYGRDGAPTRVIATTPAQYDRPCYEVEFSNGEVIVADAEHEWVVEDYRTRKAGYRRLQAPPSQVDISTLKPIPLGPVAKNLTGQKFGKLTALYPVGRRNHMLWAARCECGGACVIASNNLQARKHTCGCAGRDATIGERTVVTRELFSGLRARNGHQGNFAVRLPAALRSPEAELPIDPYVLGAWLGDGHSAGGCITSADPELIAEIGARGFRTTKWAAKYGYGILGLHAKLRLAGLLKNKHVPPAYLRASENQRLDLLRGLMDTDGYCSADGKCSFSSTSSILADQVNELACSLGWRSAVSEGVAKLNGRVIGPKFTVHFAPKKPVFLLPRKAARQVVGMARSAKRSGARDFLHVVEVRPCPSVPVRCIQVENDEGVFLAGRSMVPTHNSRISATIATFLARFRDYSPFLAPGEYGTVMVVAADRKQARTVFGYIRAFFMENELLRDEVESETQESITLKNRIRIEVHTASFKSIRGYTVVAAVLDEIAVWNSEGANPDGEIVTAVRSRFATIPSAIFMAISSPYARVGELWNVYDRHFGEKGDPDVFVWQSNTRSMNPTVTKEFVRKQYERDPARARAEYGGEFRTDIEKFVPLEIVRECMAVGQTQIPPAASCTYRAFVDPSGGRGDPMVMTIGHRSGDTAIHDATLSVSPPFVPREVVKRMVEFARPYRIHKVYGDRFAGEWPRDEFRQNGMEYELYSKSKSELFVDCLPHLFSKTVRLLDDPELAVQFSQLERRSSPSGKEIIDHPPHGHDDKANAVAGMVRLLMGESAVSCVW